MFFQPWGFLLLTGLGALLAIYFLQRRFRSRQVSSLMLWRLPRLPQQGGRTWRRLRTPPPFWLELLVIVLLALAAAAPHFKLRENRRPLAVVLDDSFSMRAGSVDVGQPEEVAQEASNSIASPADSPRALALGALMEELGQGRHAPVHLVLAGQEASLLAQGLRDQEALLGALDGWKCQAPSADLASGVALARRLAGDLGRVLVLSDHAPETDSPAQTSDGPDSAAASGQDLDAATGSESEDGQPYLEAGETRAGASPFVHWSFGRPRGNLALINAGRSSASSRNFVEVANLGDSPVRAVVKIETLRSAVGVEADAADASETFRQPEGSDGRSAQPAGGVESSGGGSESASAGGSGDGSGVDPQASTLSLSQRTLELAPGETVRLVFQADRRRPLRLSLPPDALEADNHALLLPEDRPPVRVEMRVGDPDLERLLQRALQASGQAQIVEAGPEIVILTSSDAPQDPLEAGRPWRLRLISESGARPRAGPFVVDRTHPLGQGLNLSAVLWAASPGPLPGNPVILADEIPLLTVRPALNGSVDMWMRLHPPASNVQRTADWPILVYNLLNWRQDRRPGPLRSNLRSGEQARVRLSDGSQITVRLPDETSRTFSPTAGEVALRAVQPGLYRIANAVGRDYAFSANVLHPDESELRRAATGRWGQWIDQAARRWEYADLAWIPLLAALLVLLLHQLLTGGYLVAGLGEGGRP